MDGEEEHQRRQSNWTETVEDLVTAGDTDAAISLLESVVSDLQTSEKRNQDSQLATALTDLSALYFSKGQSLKADHISAEALVLKHAVQASSTPREDRTLLTKVSLTSRDSVASVGSGNLDYTRDSPDNAVPCDGSIDDDWEAIADRPPNELLSLQREPDEPKISVREPEEKTIKRRGRGTFSYNKDELYSDKLSDSSTVNDTNDENASQVFEGRRELKSAQYGTQHVLVLADFPLSTKTTDLERLLGNFMNSGVVIRWINDTAAIAVFQTPSAALEALNHVKCSFTVRILGENDTLLSKIPLRDLEPPKQRPKTSARTAQRLIAQGMGLKLPLSPSAFGAQELRKQEEDRKNRIISRQKLRDEAWGDDDSPSSRY